MTRAKCIVFLGPSLPRNEAAALFDGDYRAPAGQGDIYRACAENPVAIGLIDGIFKDAPTVRHREILWALSQGIPVFGASSMGALRASELSNQGMIGVGLIYRWYRRYALLPDDAVAVTHGPAELGSPPLSQALVDIRRNLRAATRQGMMSAHVAQAHVQRITALPFAERRLPTVALKNAPSQKAKDARNLLKQLSDHAAHNNWPVPRQPEPPVIHAWVDDLRDSGLTPPP